MSYRRPPKLSPTAIAAQPSGDVFVQNFESMADFLRYIETTPIAPNIKAKQPSGSDWAMSSSLEHAFKLTERWQEGADEIAKFSAPIVENISSQIERLDIYNDVTGASLDIGLFCAGEPECWQVFEPSIQEGKGSRLLKIVCNSFVSGGVATRDLMKRGIFVAATIHCLELAGFSVELWSSLSVGEDVLGPNHRKCTVNCNVLVKPFDSPLDLARLAFVTAHPSMFRRLYGAWMDCTADKDPRVKAVQPCWGFPCADVFPGDIVFPQFALGQRYEPSDLIDILKKQGVQFSQQMETLA